MPILPQFIDVAEDMNGATVALSGDSRAVLFSALAALSQLWQWTKSGGLDASDIDYIDSLLAKANTELMRGMIGQIIMYTNDTPPEFTLPCDGGTYAREDYPLLYAAIAAPYIVDADTFTTPDMASRSPIGNGAGAGLSTYTINEQAGEENHTLTSGEMPSHQHGLFTSNSLAVAPGELPVKVPAFLAADLTDLAGGGGAHNTIHPVTAVQFAVVYQ